MPKVAPEHLEARRRQILDAARRCFAAEGFHATSMQDILAASGLSAGAVYRYFPGKEAIVTAIASESLAQVTAAIDAMAGTDPLPSLDTAITRLGEVVLEMERAHDFPRLVIQIWSEALRDPDVARQVVEIITVARSRFAALIRAHQRAGRLPDDVAADDIAAMLASVLPGFVLQHVLVGDVRPETFGAGVRALLAANGLP